MLKFLSVVWNLTAVIVPDVAIISQLFLFCNNRLVGVLAGSFLLFAKKQELGGALCNFPLYNGGLCHHMAPYRILYL
jgi:hypothetical protein